MAEPKKVWREDYPLSSQPKGQVLIINNERFKNKKNDRHGSGVDCDNLKNLFQDLGFGDEEDGPDVEENLSAKMLEAVQDFVKKKDWNKVDSAVVCILTHGSKDGILYGVDEEKINLRDLIVEFGPIHCPGLRGKPKIFIVQACRGSRVDGRDGANLSACCSPSDNEEDFLDQGALANIAFSSIDDILMCYATGWDFPAFRNKKQGSIYINELIKAFRHPVLGRKGHDTVLTNVKNNVVAQRTQDQMQCPGYYSHLSKKIRLQPKNPN